MSLLLDALRRSQNKGQAKEAPAESAELPAAQEPVEPPFAPTVVAPVDVPTEPTAPTPAPAAHQALELTLDPIEPSPPESASAPSTLAGSLPDLPALPEAPELTEAPGLIDQSVSLAASERAEPLPEPQPPLPAPAPASAAPAPTVSTVPVPAPLAMATEPLSQAMPRPEPIDVPRPRPAVSAQETAQAMFNAAGTSAPASPPQRDGSRARRLQWSLVIGLTLAALTWMAWQYWLSTQTPGLIPAGGAQMAPVAIQDEVAVAPPADEPVSQGAASASAPASANQVAAPVAPVPSVSSVSSAPSAASARAGSRVRVAAAQPSKAASSGAASARQGDAGVRPAQLVRSQAQQQLQSAWAALREGDAARAQALYQQVLAARPNDPDAALGLAVSLHRQRQLQAAWDAYQRSLQLWPDNETARTGMLAILSESDPDTAESRLQEWVQSRPRDAAAQAALGNLLGKQGRWAQALGPLTLAQSLAPNSAPHAYNLAVALDQARRYDEALQMYRRTLQLGAGGVPQQALERRIQELQGASAR